MNIVWGILWGFIAQSTTFIQLQGSLKYDFLKNNLWLVLLMGIPTSFMYMQSVKYFVEAFNGEIWPSRLIGFGIGVIVFSLMSHYLFKEPFTMKTGICLSLGLCIILVQLFWK
jgi:multidrug transporter EmrE-like cation transporter